MIRLFAGASIQHSFFSQPESSKNRKHPRQAVKLQHHIGYFLADGGVGSAIVGAKS
jgi:hypothetical protein